MSDDHSFERNEFAPAEDAASAAQLFAPIAFEHRLQEARTRRAEALARRRAEQTGASGAGGAAPGTTSATEPLQPGGATRVIPDPSACWGSEVAAKMPEAADRAPDRAEVSGNPSIAPAADPDRTEAKLAALENHGFDSAVVQPISPAQFPGPLVAAWRAVALRPRHWGPVEVAAVFFIALALGGAAAYVAPGDLAYRTSARTATLAPARIEPSPALETIGSLARSPATPSPMIEPDVPRAPEEATGGTASSAPSAVESSAPVTAPSVPGLEVARNPVLLNLVPSAAPFVSAPDQMMAQKSTPAAEPTPAAPSPPAARVSFYAPSSLSESALARAVTSLREAGFNEIGTVRVPIPIGRTNVRYFHDKDAATARTVAAALEGDGAEARDFRHLTSLPATGTLEIWLAGSVPAPPSAHTLVAARQTPPEPAEPPVSAR